MTKEMSPNEKRILIIGGIIAGGFIIWLLLQRAGVVGGGNQTNIAPSGLDIGPTNIAGDTFGFTVGGPGAVTFSGPASPGSADGTVAPCNCPDVNTTYFGSPVDQASATPGPSIQDFLTNLGTVLNNVLPPPTYGQGSILQRRVAAFKTTQAEYNTPATDINAAFYAMNNG